MVQIQSFICKYAFNINNHINIKKNPDIGSELYTTIKLNKYKSNVNGQLKSIKWKRNMF